MAIMIWLEFPGVTTTRYDQLTEILGIGGEVDAPDGLVSHVCGVTGDGILLVNVWDSEESMGRFYDERLAAALREAGIAEGPAQTAQVHSMFPSGDGTAANVIMMLDFPAGTGVYDQLAARMESHRAGGPQPWVSHVAGARDGGALMIVDLWDSPEAFGTFAEEQIVPAMTQLGMGAGAEPDAIAPVFIPVHNYIRGRAGS